MERNEQTDEVYEREVLVMDLRHVHFEEEIKDRRWLLEHIEELDVDSEDELSEVYRMSR